MEGGDEERWSSSNRDGPQGHKAIAKGEAAILKRVQQRRQQALEGTDRESVCECVMDRDRERERESVCVGEGEAKKKTGALGGAAVEAA